MLILPGMGIVAEIIANNTRKPLWGYKSLVLAALVLGFLSFIVWAHHMWLTGMGTAVERVFPDDDDDHLDPIGHHPERVFHLALGRIDSLYRADALRDGVPADVRDRRSHGHTAGLQQRLIFTCTTPIT